MCRGCAIDQHTVNSAPHRILCWMDAVPCRQPGRKSIVHIEGNCLYVNPEEYYGTAAWNLLIELILGNQCYNQQDSSSIYWWLFQQLQLQIGW
jgi:hypothetical protein